MIVVEIQDPEDGRLSHEVGPFPKRSSAEAWRLRFLDVVDFAGDFVEVRDVDRRLVDPEKGWEELMEFYGDA